MPGSVASLAEALKSLAHDLCLDHRQLRKAVCAVLLDLQIALLDVIQEPGTGHTDGNVDKAVSGLMVYPALAAASMPIVVTDTDAEAAAANLSARCSDKQLDRRRRRDRREVRVVSAAATCGVVRSGVVETTKSTGRDGSDRVGGSARSESGSTRILKSRSISVYRP